MMSAMTEARLAQLLDAYGAHPARWPDEERLAAERLIAASPAARARLDQAAALDRLLDALPAERPNARLAARVLAAAPRGSTSQRQAWRRALAVAVPLAAAAAALLWVMTEQKPATQTIDIPLASLGTYESPTDALLDTYGSDMYATVPSIGCTDSTLGCTDLETFDERSSHRQVGKARA
jgi:ParB-like chromosome segregation protein Spo0J